VDGLDLATAPLAARRLLGYAPEHPALHGDATVPGELDYVAALRDVPSRDPRRAPANGPPSPTRLARLTAPQTGTLSRAPRRGPAARLPRRADGRHGSGPGRGHAPAHPRVGGASRGLRLEPRARRCGDAV